jgi:hypothetical protein
VAWGGVVPGVWVRARAAGAGRAHGAGAVGAWDHGRCMGAAETVTGLAQFDRRGAGTDSERRAALWLCAELQASGHEARLETFWCRPSWALAHAWHVALGLAGSLIAISHPSIGAAMILVAILSVIADAVTGHSPGRRLTPERASQNVVVDGGAVAGVGAGIAAGTGVAAGPGDGRVRLIITANYDAGRVGLAYRDRVRAACARLRAIAGGLSPGWLGWLMIGLFWLLAVAILRLEGTRGTAAGIAQLLPTVSLVIALAMLLELASADFGPAAGDNGSGVATALAVARALDAGPPGRLAVDLVLQGAGDGDAIGLRRYLRSRRKALNVTNTVVLGIAPCGAGHPRWWVSDGPLVPLGYFRRLRALCADVARAESNVADRPHRGRGVTPALPARALGLPAITIGCLDERGLVPRSHTLRDAVAEVDHRALDAALGFALELVDAIDADVGRVRQERAGVKG